MSKCPYCKNALMIGEIGEYKAYICSKSLHIKDDCQMYKKGIPRDENLKHQIPVKDLPEIQCGTGKPLLEQALIDGYKEKLENFATNVSDRYLSPLEHWEEMMGAKYAHSFGRLT